MQYKLTKRLKIFAPLFLVVLFVCFISINIKNNTKNNQIQNQDVFKDKLQVSSVIGVFLGPNETEVSKMNSDNGEGIEEYVSDSQYYQELAWEFLKKQNIKTVFTTKRYLEFTKNNGEKILIDREKINLKDWGIYLFDGEQNPLKVEFLGDIFFNDYINYFNIKK